MTVVAVTGASGFVGQQLVRVLADRRYVVEALVRRDTWRSDHTAVSTRIVGDINAETRWSTALKGVDVLIHCAGLAHTMYDKLTGFGAHRLSVNRDGTFRLAREAARNGVRRLIFLSSVKAVGERTSPGCAFRISDGCEPEDEYGRSKHDAELVLRDVSVATGLELVIVRPPLVYGPGVRGNFLRLLGIVAKGLPLPLGGIDNARSMVSLANLVDFLIVCLESPSAKNRTFFVSDGEDLSTPSLVRKLAAIMGKRVHLLPVPIPILDCGARLVGKSAEMERLVGNLQIDIDFSRRVLGWAPRFSVESGLRETVDWYLRRL